MFDAGYWFCVVDINECSVTAHGCAHFCTNNDGSFRCSCRSGFVLESDGKSCAGLSCGWPLFSSFQTPQKKTPNNGTCAVVTKTEAWVFAHTILFSQESESLGRGWIVCHLTHSLVASRDQFYFLTKIVRELATLRGFSQRKLSLDPTRRHSRKQSFLSCIFLGKILFPGCACFFLRISGIQLAEVLENI